MLNRLSVLFVLNRILCTINHCPSNYVHISYFKKYANGTKWRKNWQTSSSSCPVLISTYNNCSRPVFVCSLSQQKLACCHYYYDMQDLV